MGILAGKRILITGVLTDASIAFHVAKAAQEEGATVVLTGYGRMSLVQRIAKRLPEPPPVIELDVADEGHLATLASGCPSTWTGWTGCCTRSRSPRRTRWAATSSTPAGTTWPPRCTCPAYSLKALAMAVLPLMNDGGSIVGLDFDASVAWPGYDWMGVAKAGLESCARYLARDLGRQKVRVNLVSAGPLRTMAAKSIPGFEKFEGLWAERAPLGWDITDPGPAAKACVALLSDWFPATSGEIVHVDGGAHAIGG